ncbi:MAG: GC-type dockerin domain-anchored protein [Planctomycetota bacterium]
MLKITTIAATGLIAAASTSAQSYRIDLTNSQNQTISPDVIGNTWNNYLPGTFLSGLFDTGGAVSGGGDFFTGIGFGATTPLGTSLPFNEGLNNPDPLFLGELAIVEATEDHHFRFAATLGYEISNLEPDKAYTIRMFGTRLDGFNLLTNEYSVTGGNGTQSANTTIGGPNTGSDGASFANDFEIIEFTGVTPVADDNNIIVEAAVVDGTFAVISIIEIITEDVVAPTRLCADQNGDGLVTPSDFTSWVLNFNSSNLLADANQDGLVTPADFTSWVLAFNQGANGPTCNP